MNKCKFCGAELADGTAFCSTCGAKTDTIPTYDAKTEQASKGAAYNATRIPTRDINIGMLVWSVINIIFGSCVCLPFILGVISIVFTVLAKDALTDEKSAQYIKLAKIINIVTSVLIAVALIVMVVLAILGVAAGTRYYRFFY